jgi:signal transduction histidine kinase
MTLHRFFQRLIWLCMMPLVVLGSALVATHVRTIEERRNLAEQSLARAVARDLDQMLEIKLSGLELLARAMHEQAIDATGRLNAAHARTLAEHYLAVQGSNVMISSASGDMLINTRFPKDSALPGKPNFAGFPTVARAISTGSKVVGDGFFGTFANKELVGLAVPMLPGYAEPLGMMSAIETAELQRRIEQFQLPSAWSLTVKDSTGRVMAHTGAGKATIDEPASVDEKQLVRVALAQAPWTVTLHAPPASLLDSTQRQAGLLIFTLGLTVALAYWAGRLASRRLENALASLTPAASNPSQDEEIDEVRKVRQRILNLQHERTEAQERERQRIGLELHDDLQQRLAVLRNDVALLQRQKPKSEASTADASSSILQRIDDTIAATRHLVNDLRPQVLDDLGVAQGLRLLTQRMRESHGLNIDLQLFAEERAEHLPKPVATALYRVTQEALSNVRKHAQASVVHVTLDLREEDAAALEIVDDGVGFEVLSSETTESHGLRGMLERVQALRGSLKIESLPGEGTAIVVRLPISPNHAPDHAPESTAVPVPESAPEPAPPPAPQAPRADLPAAPAAGERTTGEPDSDSPKTGHTKF